MNTQTLIALIGLMFAATAAIGQTETVGPIEYDPDPSEIRIVADPDADIFDPVVGGIQTHNIDPVSESDPDCDGDDVNNSHNDSTYLFAAGGTDAAVFHMAVDHERGECETHSFSEVKIFFNVSTEIDYAISGFYDAVGGNASVVEVRLTNVDTATDYYNGVEATGNFSATNNYDLAALAGATGSPTGTLVAGNYELLLDLAVIDFLNFSPDNATATGEAFVLLGDSVNPVNDIDGDGTDNLDDPCPTSAAVFCPCEDNNAVDVVDLLFILGAWGTPAGDVDDDGDTTVTDLLAVLGAWGPC